MVDGQNRVLQIGNNALTDGRTDTQTQIFERRVSHNTPHFLKWRGIKSSSGKKLYLTSEITHYATMPMQHAGIALTIILDKKNIYIFSCFAQNIDCGYTLEPNNELK